MLLQTIIQTGCHSYRICERKSVPRIQQPKPNDPSERRAACRLKHCILPTRRSPVIPSPTHSWNSQSGDATDTSAGALATENAKHNVPLRDDMRVFLIVPLPASTYSCASLQNSKILWSQWSQSRRNGAANRRQDATTRIQCQKHCDLERINLHKQNLDQSGKHISKNWSRKGWCSRRKHSFATRKQSHITQWPSHSFSFCCSITQSKSGQNVLRDWSDMPSACNVRSVPCSAHAAAHRIFGSGNHAHLCCWRLPPEEATRSRMPLG